MKRYISLLLTAISAYTLNAANTESGLNAKEFDKYWKIESEGPCSVSFRGDTAEFVAPKGLSVWRKDKMAGKTTIEYDAQVVSEHPDDRLSDLNCFWMATDPDCGNPLKSIDRRKGVFLKSYTLKLYYMGYGGNHNSTTRFRRYTGDPRGIDSAEYRPKIIKEYTDADNLLKPGKWYHIKITTDGLRTQYYIDGKRLVDYRDPEPLTEGWFAFRTTLSRTRLTNFKYSCAPLQESEIPLTWIGETPESDAAVTLGVPFEAGAVGADIQLTLKAGENPIATESWPLAYWPDGTIKWAAVAGTIPAGEKPTLKIEQKQKKKKNNREDLLAKDLGNQITIKAGKSTLYIPKPQSDCGTSRCIIDSIVTGRVKTAENGRLVATVKDTPRHGTVKATQMTGKLIEAEIERNGSERAVVKLTGCQRTEEGREWLPWTLRIVCYRSSEDIQLTHTFIFDGDQDKDFISALGIAIDVPMRERTYNRHVAFATENRGVWSEPVQPLVGRRAVNNPATGTPTPSVQAMQMKGERIADYQDFDERSRALIDEWAEWDGYRLSQNGPDGYSIRKRATTETPWIGTFGGSRAQGVVYAGDTSGGLAVAIKDFWESAPSGLEVSNARGERATVTAWLWNPDAEPMDLRHYDERAHGLNASYEDVQEGMSTPYGIARTTTIGIRPDDGYRGKEHFAAIAASAGEQHVLLPTPDYLQRRKAFGVWSLPDRSTKQRVEIEDRLDQYTDFYKKAIEENRWYGFWNYGDVMHAYDPERHSWRYDIGGFAWDNTELASNLWLWYQFLRTADAEIWRMATAMTRHASEVDVYHIGPNAGLGSRHNVSHWGCGAKEARISQAGFNRIMYYLTADERLGDLMSAVADSDQKLYEIDPMRLAEPRDQYPCTAPARLRIGPDWLAYAGNWMTEWERTQNTAYRDKISAGMQSICALPSRLFTGPLALGYDPATGVITSECDPQLQTTNHLMTIMGGFEIMNEMMELLPDKEWKEAWLEHATNYKQKALEIKRNKFRVSRLQAYSAWQRGDNAMAKEAWQDLLTRAEHKEAPKPEMKQLSGSEVPAPMHELLPISTNDAALWSLDAIYMLEVIAPD